MGLARGIFMVDTHVAAQANKKDNSEMLLYHMEKYGVDMCVIKNNVWMSNQINAEIAQRYPNKFVALCNDLETQTAALEGRKPWNVEDCVAELRRNLDTGLYRGIGCGIPRDRATRKKLITWDERLDQICQIFDVAREYKSPMIAHQGVPINSANMIDMVRGRAHAEIHDNTNPLLIHEVASLYPDIPILLGHGGVEASGYYMDDYEKCLNVAASHHNVFIEVGSWWTELFYKPLKDPNIGAKKLVWGCAWGQNNQPQQWMPGEIPETYPAPNMYADSSAHQVDVWGWSLGQIGKLNIPQDDMNLILGGNAAFLYKLKTPLPYERMFRKVDRKFEWG